MKKIIIFMLGFSLIQTISGQDEIQTLFGGETRFSGFGGPYMTFTSIGGEFAHMMGGGGGVLLGDFFFGGYGAGLTNTIEPFDPELEFGHGGFWTGYSLFAKKAIHPSISTQIGWGGITEAFEPQVDKVFVVNPTIELEMNFTRFLRTSIGAHYRFVFGVDQTSGLSDQDFTSPGVFIAFKFGWF